jgi:hypothetical protein
VSPRESRYARNQELFREVNNRIAELATKWGDQPLGIVCECANTGCSEMIQVPVEEYRRVRQSPEWFLIIPGHIVEAEQVIEQHDGYTIVTV